VEVPFLPTNKHSLLDTCKSCERAAQKLGIVPESILLQTPRTMARGGSRTRLGGSSSSTAGGSGSTVSRMIRNGEAAAEASVVTPGIGVQAVERRESDEDVQMQMERYGFASKQSREKVELGRIVRNELFKKMKFAQPDKLSAGGKVYKFVKRALRAEEEEAFRVKWETWMRKHVRKSIGDKRSTLSQCIQSSVVKGKSMHTIQRVSS